MNIVSNDALFVDNELRGLSPKDGQPLPAVALTAPDAVFGAVKRAREAQKIWSQVPAKERAARLKKLGKALLHRAEKLADIMAQEQGKSMVESYTGEIVPSAELFGYWAKMAPKLLKPQKQSLNPINFPQKSGAVWLAPRGVVGLIAPWNYPVSIPLRTLVPALAAGNAVVFKPSEYAARVGQSLAEIFDDLGVPNLVTVIQGGGDVAQRLIDSGVDYVVFTGSVPTGRKVASACADRLIKCSLELGGKDAAIVLADADLDRAADGIVWGAFANAGQNCASIERVYVVQSVAQPFIERVLERTQALKLGGTSDTFDVGPLVRKAGLETVQRHIDDAVKTGAKLIAGGKASGVGLHYEPTVLTDVQDDMLVMSDETFGPVLPIATVKDEEEALERTNQSVFKLTTSLWTRNLKHGQALAKKLTTGVVTINNHSFTAALPHAPWHGSGQTGGGVTNSPYAFYEMCEPRFVLVDKARAKELWWFPHNQTMQKIAKAIVLLFGHGKVSAAGTLLKLMPKRWS